MPTDLSETGEQLEQIYFDVAQAVLSQVSIPVSLKIGSFFSNMTQTITKLSQTGIKGLVLFIVCVEGIINSIRG